MSTEDDYVSNQGDDDEPVELFLVRALWRWSAAAGSSGISCVSVESDVAGGIESFLSGLFGESNSPAVRHWWLDGVTELRLTQPSPNDIHAVGATIWAGYGPGFYLAPFECEFHFTAPDDPECERIVVRFGKKSETGDIVRQSYKSNAHRMVETRPVENSAWAFAVEIS